MDDSGMGERERDLNVCKVEKCMDVNIWNYRWLESHSKACQMCDKGEDETVVHMILESGKYDSLYV